jgi:hypothetical protein
MTIHNATGGNEDAPSTRRVPRRYAYRLGDSTPAGDLLDAVAEHLAGMLRLLEDWGYTWDTNGQAWTGPGAEAFRSPTRTGMAGYDYPFPPVPAPPTKDGGD